MSASHMQPLTVAATLHRYRLTAGYTQEELAERAGISARSISDLERGISKTPHADTLDGLADALGLSPDDRTTLNVAARARRTLSSLEPNAVHGSRTAFLGHGLTRSVDGNARAHSPDYRYPLVPRYIPGLSRRVAVGFLVLFLTAGLALVVTHITNPPASTFTPRAFHPWPVTQTRPAVLGSLWGFAADRDGNLFVATDDALPSKTGLWKIGPSGQVLGHWNRYGRDIIHGYDISVDALGNVFLSDSHADRIYKLSPQGRWVAAWGSRGTKPGQFIQAGGVAADVEGHVYVGDATGRIQKFSATGSLLAVWPNCGVNESAYCHPADMATDVHNNLYVADLAQGNIRKLTREGKVLAVWSSLTTRASGFFVAGEISVDVRGNVFIADPNNSRIDKLTPTGKPLDWWGSTAPAIAQPSDLAIDSNDNVYVGECCPDTIHKFSSAGVPWAHWEPFETSPVFLRAPAGIAIDRQGRLIVMTADRLATILVLSPDGRMDTSWRADTMGKRQAHAPAGVTVDAGGNVYVLDAATNRIVKLSPSGALVHSWGGEGAGPGQLENPSGVVVDYSGNVYVSDAGNYRVVKYSPTGIPFALWGASATLVEPSGVALDAGGHVYVADSGTHTIKKLSSDGHLLTQWGGSGNETLLTPSGVAVDAHGNVFVTDTGDDRIKEFSSSGDPIAVWGQRGTAAGQFLQPGGIAIDQAGVVWVADTGNNRLQRMFTR